MLAPGKNDPSKMPGAMYKACWDSRCIDIGFSKRCKHRDSTGTPGAQSAAVSHCTVHNTLREPPTVEIAQVPPGCEPYYRRIRGPRYVCRTVARFCLTNASDLVTAALIGGCPGT